VGDEYAELFAQGLNGEIPLHELVLRMLRFNIEFIPPEVGVELNKDITRKQIEDIETFTK